MADFMEESTEWTKDFKEPKGSFWRIVPLKEPRQFFLQILSPQKEIKMGKGRNEDSSPQMGPGEIRCSVV